MSLTKKMPFSPKLWAATLIAKCVPTVQAINMSFPKDREEIQLDLVGLLTVIGEAAMTMHSQTITVSWLCYLPRILPAPQAFLQPVRPIRLPPNLNVTTVGVYSGNVRRHLSFIPSLLHDIDTHTPFSIREVHVTKLKDIQIKARYLSPLSMLTMLGVMVSLGLIVAAILLGDPVAIMAVALLSVTSTLTGIGSSWKIKLAKRVEDRDVPPGDVVMKAGQGAFILARCGENIARELYFGQEACDYRLDTYWFRVCAGTGTFTLMAAVVALANCKWWMQASIGLTYIAMNSFYWFAAVLPQRLSWDLDMYKITPVKGGDFDCKSYTEAVSKLIKITKTAKWCRIGEMVPTTSVWNRWVDEADENVDNENWDGCKRLSELLKSKPLP